MKVNLREVAWVLFLAAVVYALAYGPPLVHGANIQYTFRGELDIPVPDHPTMTAFPDSLNDHGDILSNINVNNLINVLIVDPINPRQNKFKAVTFNCTGVADTLAFKLTNDKATTGLCLDASKQFGFVRFANGSHILLDFPGADGTGAFGRTENGKVVGQFYGPLRIDHGGAMSYRFHCFIYDPATNRYIQIDYPVPNTYVTCPAINKNEHVLMEYITVDLDNNYIRHGWTIYANGIFTDLEQTFEHVGGPWIYFSDMNNNAAVIGAKSKNDGTPPQIVFCDDGVCYNVTGMQAEWILLDVGGMNNKNEFVGRYCIQVGIDPTFEYPILECHGFLATPTPVNVAKEKQ